MAGFDNLTTGFGRGHNGMFVSGLVTNSSTTTSNLTESSAITITAQIDTVDANDILITDMAGLEVQGYCNGVGSSATNFYGFYYNAPAGDESANLGTTGHYSFYGADSNATLFNAGHIVGNSFGQGSPYDIGTISNTATDFDIDYSNGGFQKVNLTAAGGLATTVMNAPTNMADGDILYLHITCTIGSPSDQGEIVYETSAGYVAPGSGVNLDQGNEKLLTIIKSGTKFVIEESSALTEL
jgi:hypothetical protein